MLPQSSLLQRSKYKFEYLYIQILYIQNKKWTNGNGNAQNINSNICVSIFYISSLWVISPIINKRLYLTLFELATTPWVFTITQKNTTWIFSDFFKISLTTLYTHRIIEFSKTLISNHFFLGLWILKKNVKTYVYGKKAQLFEKKYDFSDRNARKYSKSKIDFKNMFLRFFRHFDSQFYIFFEKLRLFYIWYVIFKFGFARVHNDFFFFIYSNKCKFLLSIKCSFLKLSWSKN